MDNRSIGNQWKAIKAMTAPACGPIETQQLQLNLSTSNVVTVESGAHFVWNVRCNMKMHSWTHSLPPNYGSVQIESNHVMKREMRMGLRMGLGMKLK